MGKILLIDDYKTSRELLAGLLQDKGFQVDAAADGETGYAQAQQGDYDLILIDLILPRISAYSLVEQLIHLSPPFPVQKIAILYTIGSDQLLEPIKELGVTQFILKSTTNQDAVVSQIVGLLHPDPAS